MPEYFVAPTGNDTNGTGTTLKPFKTIQKGVSILVAGDTLTVRAGTYAGVLMGYDSDGLYGPKVGTPVAPIIIRADPTAAIDTVIINAQNNKEQDGVTFYNCNYVTIQGFFVIGSASKMSRDCIRSAGSDNISIINNHVTGAVRFGIFHSSGKNPLIKGNNIDKNPGKGDATSGHGIYLSSGTINPIVRANKITNNGSQGMHVNGDVSENPIGVVSGALIEQNIIGNNTNNGINCDGMISSRVQDNIIYGSTKHGISLFHDTASQGSINNVIVNNTIYNPQSQGAGIQLALGSTGNIIQNNFIFGGISGAINLSADSKSGFISDFNITSDHFNNYDTDASSTLAQWKAMGYDIHSSVGVPTSLFVNAAQNDFHLTATSAGINAGTGTQLSVQDADGNTRVVGASVDIGAYEFGGIIPPPPIVRVRNFVVAGKITNIGTLNGPEGIANTVAVTYQQDLTVSGSNPDVNGDHIIDIADMVGVSNAWNKVVA